MSEDRLAYFSVTCYLVFMLDKRTNVLLNSTQYKVLTSLSKSEGVTLGELIRRAIDMNYVNKLRENRGARALNEIDNINKGKPKLSNETILSWIREGRK
ncbi:hypothetical protein COT50_00120 [candidate division WWE3 bacterium CG08_land_8_20_14_0_20_41_10]|uniref:CopG family transcriptional regulator n=1 Tax=candidate division WWE3 bacterium CG08_land_8_20_14_0_20_41_10 TaxID=1975085 RepID=A0A2H0XCV6_UNCKA|nr:MAG: hypothetical protein COT50_00120 [candidate division WWE3 bacterium CG08_land_8_20_14_0_20_41_10]